MEKKKVSDSFTEQVHILTQSDLNGYSRLFGGTLMQWIDIVAAVTARRHCGRNVTTAAVDSLEFSDAAYANDTVVLNGYLTRVGTTSMDVCVKTYVEHLDGTRRLINTAYLLMVALDGNEKPTEVPGLIIENGEQEQELQNAVKRLELRKSRRKNQRN